MIELILVGNYSFMKGSKEMKKELTILLLFGESEQVEVKMRRYFYEVNDNVFVATMSESMRNTVWDELEKSGVEANMIIQANNEQGFIYKTTKDDADFNIKDINGFILPALPITNTPVAPTNKKLPASNVTITLDDIFAKLDRTLIDHIFDVAVVAEALMRFGRAYNMTKSIAEATDTDFETTVNSICWLCALHDIGKAHPNFIAKMYANSTNTRQQEIYRDLLDKGLVREGDYTGFRHERFSRDILKKYFANNSYPIEANDFADLVAYHHQGKDENDFSDKITINDGPWLALHDQIIELVEKEYKFDRKFATNRNFVNGVNYSILSIMITADWIASGELWREMVDTIPDRKYCAKKFLTENALLYRPMGERFENIEWHNAFNFEANDMQIKTIEASNDQPELMIIEYPCGGGKTEAALSAAIHMGQDKTGIFIATPTMATAKGMTLRMNELAKRIGLGFAIPEYDSSNLWSDNDMLKIPPELWTSKSRHRMLYPFAVGTVDQVLKTMLYYRYAAIGLMGLSDKVLIIDEVHAYDSYMKTEIKMLLKWCKFLHIPVIMLSATLPTLTKVDLLRTMGCKKEDLNISNEYPLITTCNKTRCKSYYVRCTGKKFKINIIETQDYEQAWENEIAKKYNGCTAFIEGTVDQSWALFNMANKYKLRPMIFNGRDTLEHKEKKTLDLLSKLGKNKNKRPKKLTLTATSIIEQSLDIDLDRMFTCIAPIDLLIQRFGRVQRHSDKGTIRETETIDNPINIIISTKFGDMPCSKIYGVSILQKTIEVLRGRTEIDTVKDARTLIDAVYQNPYDIDRPKLIISANFNCIEDPAKDAMFDNDNTKYARFKALHNATRFETYPTISIAIINNPDEIFDIEHNYDKIKKIMMSQVVEISEYKNNDIEVTPLTFEDHKLLSDIQFYLSEDLLKQNIVLTADGLKFANNW